MTEKDKGLKEGKEGGRVGWRREGRTTQTGREKRKVDENDRVRLLCIKIEKTHRKDREKISIRLKTFFKDFKIDHVIILPSLVEI